MRLEFGFIEVQIAEGGEVRCLTGHIQNESLLTHNDVDVIAELGLADEVQTPFRFKPHLLERRSLQKKIGDKMIPAVTGDRKVAGFDSRAKSGLDILDSGCDWFGPKHRDFHCEVCLGPIGSKAELLDQIASEPAEEIAILIAMKNRPQNNPEPCIAGHRGVRCSILHT